jgi:hypothetical protein
MARYQVTMGEGGTGRLQRGWHLLTKGHLREMQWDGETSSDEDARAAAQSTWREDFGDTPTACFHIQSRRTGPPCKTCEDRGWISGGELDAYRRTNVFVNTRAVGRDRHSCPECRSGNHVRARELRRTGSGREWLGGLDEENAS